jgi:hypothetical protein
MMEKARGAQLLLEALPPKLVRVACVRSGEVKAVADDEQAACLLSVDRA